jgi:N-succinyldiaminopimelate aminotransferase
VIDATARRRHRGLPNPFYQIYEGAALLAGAEPYYAPSDPARNFAVDWDSVPPRSGRTQLVFVCSPGNPTGAVMPLDEWKKLFELSDRHGFVIASDECYSEIYFRDEPPLGGLEAAAKLGRPDFKNLIAFTSLSKRSNVPGLRSGFVAGDAALIKKFLLYRTYHGSAMSPSCRRQHRGLERRGARGRQPRQYRAKFAEVTPLLSGAGRALPDAGFYLWAGVPVGWRHRLRPRAARSIQCDGSAGQLPGARSAGAQPRRRPHPHGAGGRNRRMRGSRAAHRQFVQSKVP